MKLHEVLVLSVLLALASASILCGQTIEVFPETSMVPLGDPLTVDIDISELGDFASPSLGAFDVSLCFDPALLEFDDIEFGPFLGDEALGQAITGFSVVGDDLMAFEVSLLLPADLIALQPGEFTLFTVTFDTVASGTSPLELLIGGLSDELGDPLDSTVVDSSVVVGSQVDLIVSQTESVDPVIAGSGPGNLIYEVMVTNAGPSDATGLELTEMLLLPPGVTLDSVVASGGTFFTDPIWTVGDLPAGAGEALTITLNASSATAAGADIIHSTATVTAVNESVINPGDDSASESTSVERRVDLAVSKTESIDPVIPGSGIGNLTYVVTVMNAGPSDASGLELTEVLTVPPGVSVESFAPSGATTYDDPIWTVGDLGAGASETLTVVLTAEASAASGSDTVGDTATVTAVNEAVVNPGNDSASESTSVERQVDLVVTKTESVDPVLAGSEEGLTYEVTVFNSGPSDVSGVVLSEALTLPTGVTLESVIASGTTSFDGTEWLVGDLPLGTAETLMVHLAVAQWAPPGVDLISNTATVVAAEALLVNPADDSATESTSIESIAIEVPALSWPGMFLLMAALAGMGLHRTRKI